MHLIVDAIRAYTIPEEKEDYILDEDPDAMDIAIDPALTGDDGPSKKKSNLRLFPPPLFSRQSVPQNYKYARSSLRFHTSVLKAAVQFQGKSRLCRCHQRGRRDRGGEKEAHQQDEMARLWSGLHSLF